MKSRLDRYRETEQNRQVPSRLSKNRHLYDDLNNKIGFEELTNFDTQTRIELTSLNGTIKNRESYQQLKDYQGLLSNDFKEEKIYSKVEEEKNFDINSILEEARKNRTEIDELEKKRKLKDEEYNILADLNKKYLSSKEKEETKRDEYEGLEELINTITSKTLVNDIKKEEEKEELDLLGELVATSVDLQVKSPLEYENDETSKIVTKIEVDEVEIKSSDNEIDKSFYTKSMDLSEYDFDFDEENSKKSVLKKGILIALIIVILLIIIGVVMFFILQSMNINLLDLFKKL